MQKEAPRIFRLRLSDLKLTHKLILLIVLVTVIISLFSALSFQYTVQKYDALLYSQTANSLSYFSDELLHGLEAIGDTSAYIALDEKFQEQLDILNLTDRSTLLSQNARNAVWEILNRHYSQNIITLSVVPLGQEAIWWGQQALRETDDALQALFRRCDAARGQLVWQDSSAGDNSVLCARAVLRIKNLRLDKMGYLVVRVDLERLIGAISRSRYANGQDFSFFLSAESGLLYPHSADSAALFNELQRAGKEPYTIQKLGDRRLFLTFTPLQLPGLDWEMALGVPYDEVFHSLALRVPVFVASLLAAATLALLVAGHIIKSITYQFNRLVDKMERVKVGEFITAPAVPEATRTNSQDELTLLNAYFDQMTVELKKRIEDSYVKQLLITQAEFRALEQQINPHFLYNTLNTVDWLAKKAGARDISVIAESLGALLRGTLSERENMIPISQELELVRCYVRIQQIRFEELSVAMEIDPQAVHIPIPKMTIQPLVENAILHSQDEPLEEYRIRVRVQRSCSAILIEVANNGPAIDVEILQHLQDATVTPRGNGIGLLNIDARLRIIFGEQYGLHFANENGMAVVRFAVPVAPLGPQTEQEVPHG